MKSLVKKTCAILKGRRGESLMESIASILVFTVLIAAITSMIMASLQITRAATEAAGRRQNDANAVLTGGVSAVADTVELVFGEDDNRVIEIGVILSSEGDFVAFAPADAEGSGP